MVVYRLCNELEFQKILNTMSFNDIGSLCSYNSKLNNHKYQANQKYLHFFKDYNSLFYLCLKPGSYICAYDIPDNLLEKYVGIGQYLDIIFMRKLENAIEYAIPNDEILFDYLKRIDKVSKYIDYEDYLDGDYKSSLETLYDKQSKILSKKI